ncbi:MAG: FKBP-type peptidyl-prolyl cis-trans isomerase [Prevotella sp.]|nr:FKBP-type peptidyl-prolyl cis-trans isomerase [Prevotella sp.]
MKKLTFVAAMAIAVASLTSCMNSAPKADLKSDVDSLSYAFGMAQGPSLKEYAIQGLRVDSAYMNDFIKGMTEGANAGEDKGKAAYFAGLQIGQQISQGMMKNLNMQVFGEDSTKTLSMKNYLAALILSLTNQKGIYTEQEAQQAAETLMSKIKSKQFEGDKKKGEEYITKYAKGADVKTIDVNTTVGMKPVKGTVYYKVLKEGTGAIPTDSSSVKVHYEGKLIDGTVFDSSYKRGQPVTMVPSQVVAGFKAALTKMPVGSTWEVVIPQELGYGENAAPGSPIKPYSTLIFKIETISIEK